MPPSPPRILLADCDQMFVAVARQVDPEGAGQAKLLVVGGRANSRGVVCSASYETRAFGLRAGMPIAQAVRLCPEATFVPVPGRACGQAHRRIRAVLDQWAPVVVPASIDEFYLDLTGTEGLYRETLAQTAWRVRSAVLEATGLSLSIGGGTNRMVAKMAAEVAKPKPGSKGTGVLVIPPGDEAVFMAERALAEIPGVGPRFQGLLARRGLVSVRDALRIDLATLRSWLGDGSARWLHRSIRGEAPSEVRIRPANHSISHETTFGKDLVSDDAIETRLLHLVTRLAAQLRTDGLATGCVTVKLRDHDFRTRQAGRTLRGPLATDRALFAVARELLGVLRTRRRTPARLVGVSFSALESAEGPAQLVLFPPDLPEAETARDRRLARAIDAITRKLGDHAIGPARLARPSRRAAEPS